MEKNIKLAISVDRYECPSIYNDDGDDERWTPSDLSDVTSVEDRVDSMEFCTEGVFRSENGMCEIVYKESVDLGMEDTTVRLTYFENTPNVVNMTRTGECSTGLLFEENKRCISAYQIPGASFEVCVLAKRVLNEVAEKGELFLDYILELRGADAGRNKMKIKMMDIDVM